MLLTFIAFFFVVSFFSLINFWSVRSAGNKSSQVIISAIGSDLFSFYCIHLGIVWGHHCERLAVVPTAAYLSVTPSAFRQKAIKLVFDMRKKVFE